MPGKTRFFHEFGRRQIHLRHQQVADRRVARAELRAAFGLRKAEAERVVERVAGRRGKAAVPHQFWIEPGVEDGRRAPQVARSMPVRADQAVVLDADGDRLGVAVAVARRMAGGAGIVVVQAGHRVEEQQQAQAGQLEVERAAEPAFQVLFRAAAKALAGQRGRELRVELRGGRRRRLRGRGRRGVRIAVAAAAEQHEPGQHAGQDGEKVPGAGPAGAGRVQCGYEEHAGSVESVVRPAHAAGVCQPGMQTV